MCACEKCTYFFLLIVSVHSVCVQSMCGYTKYIFLVCLYACFCAQYVVTVGMCANCVCLEYIVFLLCLIFVPSVCYLCVSLVCVLNVSVCVCVCVIGLCVFLVFLVFLVCLYVCDITVLSELSVLSVISTCA